MIKRMSVSLTIFVCICIPLVGNSTSPTDRHSSPNAPRTSPIPLEDVLLPDLGKVQLQRDIRVGKGLIGGGITSLVISPFLFLGAGLANFKGTEHCGQSDMDTTCANTKEELQTFLLVSGELMVGMGIVLLVTGIHKKSTAQYKLKGLHEQRSPSSASTPTPLRAGVRLLFPSHVIVNF